MEITKKAPKPKLLGERLLEEGLITPQQLEIALKEQKRTGDLLGEILVNLGFISPDVLSSTLASQSGVEYIDLKRTIIESEALELVPESFAREKRVIPVSLNKNFLTVAMANVFDVETISELEMLTRKLIRVVSAPEQEILSAIDSNYLGGISIDELIEDSVRLATRFGGAEAAVAEEAPIVKLVDQLLYKAVKESATDLHIEPEEKIVRIRYRIDGILYSGPTIPKSLQPSITARLKILSGANIAEARLPQDGRIKFQLGRRFLDIRASFFPTIYGENIALRILDKTRLILGLDQLGFNAENLAIFKRLIEKPYGIILVTGPTGSGKTTTLYAALSYLNSLEKNIMTVEDPVEYEFPIIRQSQINPKAGYTFAEAMKSILRQDPDIIFIGEMRDSETVDMAIRAALTGHLVLSTLHTNDSVSAIPRLVDMGAEPFLIASTVIGIVAQRLVRLICENCKVQYTPSEEILKKIGWQKGNPVFYRGEGCPKCGKRGYRGRTGLFEVFTITERIRKLISEKADFVKLKETALEEGLVTLFEDGISKARSGLTTIDEVIRVTFGEY
ncbi:MAG: GspE/PulE family protein [Candidatus Aminicenantia bacterium]